MLTAASLRTTESHLAKLRKAGIETELQLLEYFPRALNDMSKVLRHFAFVDLREKNSVVATLDFFGTERTKFGKQILKAVLRDDGGNLCEAVWFGRQFWAKDFKQGDRVLIYGKPNYKFGRLSFPSPDISRYSADANLLAPIYPELDGISSDWFSGKISHLRKHLEDVYDLLPPEIRRKNGFRTRRENIEAAHFPVNVDDWNRARRELAYEELFGYQHAGLLRKADGDRASKGRAFWAPMKVEELKAVIAGLPFTLTDHQKVSLFSILKDMEKDVAMNRLLQGDVGTGKTVVAFLACWHAVKFAGAQCAVMVPTSVLSNQHYASAKKFFEPLGVRVALLTGEMTKKEQDDVKKAIAAGEADVVIGTHALIVADVHFRALGLAVIDEQHRFGVDQRKILESKSAAVYPPLTRGARGVGDSIAASGGISMQNPLNPPCQGEGITDGFMPYDSSLTEKARELRSNQTPAEAQMWKLLSRKQFGGLKFLRQKPIDKFIVDFYCSELKLAIEIDGDSHAEQGAYDARRTAALGALGVEVIRYANREVSDNPEGIFDDLEQKISNRRKRIATPLAASSPLTRARDASEASRMGIFPPDKGGQGGLGRPEGGVQSQNPLNPPCQGEVVASGIGIKPAPRVPHVLYMTATPIPRTLTLTIYGDQDVSVIRQYPAGRKAVITKVFPATGRLAAHRFIESQVQAGRQVFWISPLVEESTQLDYADVMRTTALLRDAFPDFTVGMVHGRMKPAEKEAAMAAFKSGETQILSATSVIEVGVDVPNASVICIEGAEKFGLSQLHQFRGRVGRGQHQSYCYLFPSRNSPNARLEAMEETNDGFELAEIDLELRGPGEVWGVRQSGIPDFRIADLRDLGLISQIRDDIRAWMKEGEGTSAA